LRLRRLCTEAGLAPVLLGAAVARLRELVDRQTPPMVGACRIGTANARAEDVDVVSDLALHDIHYF